MKTELHHGLDHAEPLDEQALDKVSAGNPFGIIVGAAASTLGLNGLGDKVEQIIGAVPKGEIEKALDKAL